MIQAIIFTVILAAGIYFFARNVGRIRRNILLGKPLDRNDQPAKRWKTMLRVAFGQSKMTVRPIPAFFHFIIYAGFLIINIEILEIMIDGVAGTHRVFSFLGSLYDFLIAGFEVLALLTIVACVVFLARRNILKLKEYREKAKLSQRDVAKKLGITQQGYFGWEKGLTTPNPEQIIKLCEIFKCTPNDLFGFKGVHAVTSKEVL